MIGNDKDLLKLIIRSNTVSLDESGFAENVLMYNTKPKIMTDIILESYPNFLEDNEDIESFRSLEIKYQDINHYGLFITEDDTLGNIDHDFPISEHNMPLHKFGFKSLAILESAYDS
ncbi:unnamed protein product, partial [Gordionus sp. m RMFG-2023]